MKKMILTVVLFSFTVPMLAQAGLFTDKVVDVKGSCISADSAITADYQRRLYVVKGTFVGEQGDVYEKVKLTLKNQHTGATVVSEDPDQETNELSYFFEKDILQATLKLENNKLVTLKCNLVSKK